MSLSSGEFACPSCGADLHSTVESILPEQTDLTMVLQITPGQLCMAETVAGVIENFAKMQQAIAESLDCEVSVFIAGMSYENDEIAITFRMANAPKGRVAPAGEAGTAETAKTGSVHEHATAATSGGDARKDHP